MPKPTRKGFPKGAARILGVLLVTGSVLVAWIRVRSERTFTAPASGLSAVTDPAVIARGRYLVHGPAHCADCHAPLAQKEMVDGGREADLSGGYALNTFLGEMRAPNITPDSLTGIGAVDDAALVRFFRHGIDRRGRVGLPIMMAPDLADADLVAILSYLRSTPPVRHAVPPSGYNILGRITKAFFLEPFAPDPSRPPTPPPGPTAAYGGYLAEVVANCASCHTARNMKTGEYTGPRFAGGLEFRKSDDPDQVLVSPNLTPDSATGVMAQWSLETFVARMHQGRIAPWSPMPWGPFGKMSKDDLTAVYLYLHDLDPVNRENHPPTKENR
ncbi:MAG: cytochrome C [Fibrobacteria bacterium]